MEEEDLAPLNYVNALIPSECPSAVCSERGNGKRVMGEGKEQGWELRVPNSFLSSPTKAARAFVVVLVPFIGLWRLWFRYRPRTVYVVAKRNVGSRGQLLLDEHDVASRPIY